MNLPPADTHLDLPPFNEADIDADDNGSGDDDDDDVVVTGPIFEAQVELAATIGNYFTFHPYY